MHITISEPSPEAKPHVLPLPLNGNGLKDLDHPLQAANVSITITDASPDSHSVESRGLPISSTISGTSAHSKRMAFRRASEAKIIQHKALVHRTSEGSHS